MNPPGKAGSHVRSKSDEVGGVSGAPRGTGIRRQLSRNRKQATTHLILTMQPPAEVPPRSPKASPTVEEQKPERAKSSRFSKALRWSPREKIVDPGPELVRQLGPNTAREGSERAKELKRLEMLTNERNALANKLKAKELEVARLAYSLNVPPPKLGLPPPKPLHQMPRPPGSEPSRKSTVTLPQLSRSNSSKERSPPPL